jgi:tetratricopeptide (TPR) repeat protein
MQTGFESGQRSLAVLFNLTVLIFLSTLPVSVFAHPDLMIQIESLDVQLEANPTDTELLIKRGDLYRRHQNYPAAALDFAAARKSSPDNLLLDFYEGRLLYESGDAAAAEVHFKKYLCTHPEHAKAWILRGETSIRLNQPVPASSYFARAINSTQTPSPGLYRQHILSLVSIGESKWDAASLAVDKGLQHFGFEVTLLGLGIDIALARNQSPKAEQYLKTLPESLYALPQWDVRIRTTTCLASADSEVSTRCLRQARDMLTDKVRVFMAA